MTCLVGTDKVHLCLCAGVAAVGETKGNPGRIAFVPIGVHRDCVAIGAKNVIEIIISVAAANVTSKVVQNAVAGVFRRMRVAEMTADVSRILAENESKTIRSATANLLLVVTVRGCVCVSMSGFLVGRIILRCLMEGLSTCARVA